MKKLVLTLLSPLALLMLSACGGGQKTQVETAEAVDSTDLKAKEEISGCVENLYTAIAMRQTEGLDSFACRNWWKTVDAVEEKDTHVAEIGFFNEDLWTQMQDSNPDRFEVRSLKFEKLDVEKGTALVDFVLWSPVQTIHQKFGFCREDGSWRIHNIIRFFSDADGKEEETDMMEAMTSYLAEPLEEVSEMTQ